MSNYCQRQSCNVFNIGYQVQHTLSWLNVIVCHGALDCRDKLWSRLVYLTSHNCLCGGTRLRDLVYLACRESVRLICSVTLIISKHVFTPFVLSNPIFSCSTKDWDQIWRCTDGWWCCCFWLLRLLQMPLHYFLPTVRLPSCASLISASGPHSVSAIWIWNALHAVLIFYPS